MSLKNLIDEIKELEDTRKELKKRLLECQKEIRLNVSIVNLRGKNYIQTIDTQYNQRYLLEHQPHKYFYLCYYDLTTEELFIYDKNGKLVTNDENRLNLTSSVRNTITKYNKHFPNIRKILDDLSIYYKPLGKSIGCYNPNLTKINENLNELNEKLKLKCSNLELKIGNYYDLPGDIESIYSDIHGPGDELVLCLYLNDNCISNITLVYLDNNIMEINSKTREDYGGKKYNKLLRSVVVIIASLIICHKTKIKYIRSHALNPISSWLLISNFYATYESFPPNKYYTFKDNNPGLSQKELIFSAYDNNISLNITVELNDVNIKKAHELFDKLVSESIDNSIKCPE